MGLKSATAAQPINISVLAIKALTSLSISSAVLIFINFTPSIGLMFTGPLIKLTSAPDKYATSARA